MQQRRRQAATVVSMLSRVGVRRGIERPPQQAAGGRTRCVLCTILSNDSKRVGGTNEPTQRLTLAHFGARLDAESRRGVAHVESLAVDGADTDPEQFGVDEAVRQLRNVISVLARRNRQHLHKRRTRAHRSVQGDQPDSPRNPSATLTHTLDHTSTYVTRRSPHRAVAGSSVPRAESKQARGKEMAGAAGVRWHVPLRRCRGCRRAGPQNQERSSRR
jgi:hypothetical protein